MLTFLNSAHLCPEIKSTKYDYYYSVDYTHTGYLKVTENF
jgi:hypothetical protein